MSKISDDGLRPHLTALVDGELEPLEAIALQGRLRQSATLQAECHELERLKLAVHLAGRKDEAPRALATALEAMCRTHFEGKARRRSLTFALWIPAGVALAAALVLGVTLLGGEPTRPDARVAMVEVPRDTNTEDDLLPRLAGFHRESDSPLALSDLKASGALLAIERLPDTFITPEGKKPQLIQASWMGCTEREFGATLAVLRADKVKLPADIDQALDTTGVFADVIEGVHLRLSVSGDKLFVLMSTDMSAPNQTPI